MTDNEAKCVCCGHTMRLCEVGLHSWYRWMCECGYRDSNSYPNSRLAQIAIQEVTEL